MAEQIDKETIVLIHGLWMTPRSWEKWKARYEEQGHTVLAPAWPGMEGEVEALREDPSPIAELDIPTIVDHYEEIIRGLESEPIIMGHSFGGTFAQLLGSRGLGKAVVGVAPSTVKGITDAPASTLRASASVLRNPFHKHAAIDLDERQFHYAFANTLSQEESDAIRERYDVPAARTVLFEGVLANLHRHPSTEVDFAKEHPPLLFVAFGEDHIIPPKVARHNFEKYEKSDSVRAFKEFPDRPHFPAVDGWEEVADYALAWARNPVVGESPTVALPS
jgi:pimeloyl-ACP methyl ester carboxylesterase